MSGRFGKLAQDAQTPNTVIEIQADLDGDNLTKLLKCIKHCCEIGAGTTVRVETGDGEEGKFYFDGDGADRLLSIKTSRVSQK
jgi:hypothetical protein